MVRCDDAICRNVPSLPGETWSSTSSTPVAEECGYRWVPCGYSTGRFGLKKLALGWIPPACVVLDCALNWLLCRRILFEFRGKGCTPVKVGPCGAGEGGTGEAGVKGVLGVCGLSGRAIVVGSGNWDPIELRFTCAIVGGERQPPQRYSSRQQTRPA